MVVGEKATRYDYLQVIVKLSTDCTLLQSCEVKQWVEHAETQVVQTAWAAMALMYAKYPHPEPIERAVKLVMSRQLPVSSQ